MQIALQLSMTGPLNHLNFQAEHSVRRKESGAQTTEERKTGEGDRRRQGQARQRARPACEEEAIEVIWVIGIKIKIEEEKSSSAPNQGRRFRV